MTKTDELLAELSEEERRKPYSDSWCNEYLNDLYEDMYDDRENEEHGGRNARQGLSAID